MAAPAVGSNISRECPREERAFICGMGCSQMETVKALRKAAEQLLEVYALPFSSDLECVFRVVPVMHSQLSLVTGKWRFLEVQSALKGQS
ncbi:hypothetical protein P7K49_028063 [Saguinus oedipus]|uniref:Uncharacterized protein n=1 Tax=Saguinus oedipus TaxID=9490 RepID=A0ABQ9UBB9_SAGOE|nr:hypothetical protein P7K49_028063 [Saguinus oedipus]